MRSLSPSPTTLADLTRPVQSFDELVATPETPHAAVLRFLSLASRYQGGPVPREVLLWYADVATVTTLPRSLPRPAFIDFLHALGLRPRTSALLVLLRDLVAAGYATQTSEGFTTSPRGEKILASFVPLPRSIPRTKSSSRKNP